MATTAYVLDEIERFNSMRILDHMYKNMGGSATHHEMSGLEVKFIGDGRILERLGYIADGDGVYRITNKGIANLPHEIRTGKDMARRPFRLGLDMDIEIPFRQPPKNPGNDGGEQPSV
jgi:hypothetical protein